MTGKFLKYDRKLKQVARMLRKNSTLAEILLWNELKGKQLLGYDFHRQKPVGKYILDFFCPKLMLAIEIDGSSHERREQDDLVRQHDLEQIGIAFLRFADEDVKKNIDEIISEIEEWIRKRK